MWRWVEFVVGGKRFFWLCDLQLGQAMRNLVCGDWWMLPVQIAHSYNPEREGTISEASFHGLLIIHTCLPCPTSRWVSPVFYTAFCWCSYFGGWWAGEYGFNILRVNTVLIYLFIYLFICYFIVLLFIYLFLVKGLFTIKHKYYTIFK